MANSITRTAANSTDVTPTREILAGGKVDIHERTFSFGLRVLRVVDALPRSVSGRVLAQQLARSGTSVGANVEEAQGSHSRAEFARRMNIARSEARESRYWLRLAGGHKLLPAARLGPLCREAEELIRILTVIVKRTRASRG